MAGLILVRHAVSVAPAPDGPDEYQRPLTVAGHRQAAELATVLAPARVSRVVSSPYLRAVQTVEPSARVLGLPVVRREDLREWRSGLIPSPGRRAHDERAWADPGGTFGTGESLAELSTRAGRAVHDLVSSSSPTTTILVASHGTWIARALLDLGLPVTCRFWLSLPMPALYMLTFDGMTLIQMVGPCLDGE